MHFYAKINPKGSIYTLWSSRNAVSGAVSGVLFKRIGRDYVTDELGSEQIENLKGNSGVIIEGAIVSFVEPNDTLTEPNTILTEPDVAPNDLDGTADDSVEEEELEKKEEELIAQESATQEQIEEIKQQEQEVIKKRRGRPPKNP